MAPEARAKTQDGCRAERGYVLLWTLGAIALLAWLAALMLQAADRRTALREDGSATLDMTAALNATLANLKSRLLSPSGEPVLLPVEGKETVGGIEVAWSMTRESDLYDLNRTNPATLAALFAQLGVEVDRAAALSDAIADWRDQDDLRHFNGAEEGDYVAANLAGPANEAFLDVSDLAQVIGFTPDLFACVSPYLTVFGTSDGGLPPGSAPSLAQPRAGEAVRITLRARWPDKSWALAQTRIFRITGDVKDPLWLIDVSGNSRQAQQTCPQP